MKKIINGKVYNTETAKKVGKWSNGCIDGDFNYLSEALYLKKTGEFFIYGDGGANSKYAVRVGSNSLSGSRIIIPTNYKSAQEWAEKYLDGDEYEEIFGEIDENEDIVTVGISISKSSHQKLKRMSQKQDLSVSAIIEKFVLANEADSV